MLGSRHRSVSIASPQGLPPSILSPFRAGVHLRPGLSVVGRLVDSLVTEERVQIARPHRIHEHVLRAVVVSVEVRVRQADAVRCHVRPLSDGAATRSALPHGDRDSTAVFAGAALRTRRRPTRFADATRATRLARATCAAAPDRTSRRVTRSGASARATRRRTACGPSTAARLRPRRSPGAGLVLPVTARTARRAEDQRHAREGTQTRLHATIMRSSERRHE